MHTDWLVVGAGFTGCTLAERIATQLGERVLLVDRRPQIGGNAYDAVNSDGILVHQYGPHIFHTNSAKVWEYLSQFTAWRPYEHRVLAQVDGKTIPLPFNLDSLHACFTPRKAAALEEILVREYGRDANVPLLNMRRSPRPSIRALAEFIYEKIFYHYTLKQWQLTPEQLDPLVTARVPVRIGRDDRYFQDAYQAMPSPSYNTLFRRMVASSNIELLLGVDYRGLASGVKFKRMIYTGPLDEFFDGMYGPLPYRSLRFEFTTLDQEWYQQVGTVNYPNDHAFTRITELKHISGQMHPKTTLVTEYPEAHISGRNEPYYPVPRPENQERHAAYMQEARKLNGSVIFAGRLADYRYYNMDQAVARGLHLFDEICDERTNLRRSSHLQPQGPVERLSALAGRPDASAR